MTYDQFIAIFPEFKDLVDYPISQVNFWLSYAVHFVNTQRFKSMSDQALALYTAHMLKLAQLEGEVKGILTDKEVDGVQGSYDVTSVIIKDGNHYNKTFYGIQYLQLAKMVGSGPIQINF